MANYNVDGSTAITVSFIGSPRCSTPNSFASEINRLANGGTYRAPGSMASIAKAANTWAGTTNLPLLAALNSKNGSIGFGLDHVCNALAGTTKLSALAALKEIKV